MDFCRTHLTLPRDLASRHGVLHAATLAVSCDGREVADRLIEAARVQAAALVDAQMARCQHDIDAYQQASLRQARTMLAALERMPRDFLAQVEPVVIELAQTLFKRLVGELAPAATAAALLRQLVAAAPPRLLEPVLHMHPVDAALLAPGLVPASWTLRADSALAPRRCRLESASGEWQVDFDAAALELAQTLEGAPAGAEKNH